METQLDDRYHMELAAAFVRGKLGASETDPEMFSKPLTMLSAADRNALFNLGSQAGLKLHKFKRTMELSRVLRVLGVLKGLAPTNLLDIGSGRGVFVWPLLTEFPRLDVTCMDLRQDRVDDLLAVHKGGILRLDAIKGDAKSLPFPDKSFDVVTLLEVLEHMKDPGKAIKEAIRVSRRNIIISVPSTEDNNPEHIHLLDKKTLQTMISEAGAKPRFQGVLNHLIAVATKYVSP